MFIDKYREIIETSTFNIPERLKAIDEGYFVVRNHETHQFEVHHSGQIGDTFCLSIPYDELDYRTIQRVRETQIQYIDNIVAEMERNNEKLEADRDKKLKDYTETTTREIYRYLKSHESIETIDENSQIFKEVI